MVIFPGWSFSQLDIDRPTSQLHSICYPWGYSQTPNDFSEKERLGFLATEGCQHFLDFDSNRDLNLQYLQDVFIGFNFTFYFIGKE